MNEVTILEYCPLQGEGCAGQCCIYYDCMDAPRCILSDTDLFAVDEQDEPPADEEDI